MKGHPKNAQGKRLAIEKLFSRHLAGILKERILLQGPNIPGNLPRDLVCGFGYQMRTLPDQEQQLQVRVWRPKYDRLGAQPKRPGSFEVLVEGTVIGTCKVEDLPFDSFVDLSFAIPAALTQGKQQIQVAFQGTKDFREVHAGFYECRVLKMAKSTLQPALCEGATIRAWRWSHQRTVLMQWRKVKIAKPMPSEHSGTMSDLPVFFFKATSPVFRSLALLVGCALSAASPLSSRAEPVVAEASIRGDQAGVNVHAGPIPLPEHPRPDFERAAWLNLNGPWQFKGDAANKGLMAGWAEGKESFPESIVVPFGWGTPLAKGGDPDTKTNIGWYSRTVRVPPEWKGKRIFLIVGASDWETQAWLDGRPLGTHQGGYVPFEFELPLEINDGRDHKLVLRVDDTPHPSRLQGKQRTYGNVRGIWQTAYLEARPQRYLKSIHFSPDIDHGKVGVRAILDGPAAAKCELKIRFKTGGVADVAKPVEAGAEEVGFEIPMANARLWSPEDPFLYEAESILGNGSEQDVVGVYFGMRKISVLDLPGTQIPYIALNNKPIYLQMVLDQSYNPEGFYTFPSDDFMREEILRARRLGLNTMRFHVKVEVPRKLYWADRLGMLVMADIPNTWDSPDDEMHREIDRTLRGTLERDFNHPSIFNWVLFNETWGLFTQLPNNSRAYTPETQEWVASVYQMAKQLDPTRLVDDNSALRGDHVQTDLNSWHKYLPGYDWRGYLDKIDRDTFPGSKWNFIGGRSQSRQPLINTECGNVWGYQGSTGDCDLSWDYHAMLNEFRRHPKQCGWLYTQLHDVTNEWNGYYRYDRSEKEDGLADLVTGMSLRDLHAPFYLSTGGDLCRTVKPGEVVSVPLWASFLSASAPSAQLRLKATLYGWDSLGRRREYGEQTRNLDFSPWLSKEMDPLQVTMPKERSLAVLSLVLEDAAGKILQRNFTTFKVGQDSSPRDERIEQGGESLRVVRFAPSSFTDSAWSLKQWNVLDGLKVNGAGAGHFEYRIPWPENLDPAQVSKATICFEASAKQLFGKDQEGAELPKGDVEMEAMLGGGSRNASRNPNAYPMTDTLRFPSSLRVLVGGMSVGQFELPDDPADHRGILSWHSQLRDKKLREAGSYGYLINAEIPQSALTQAAQAKQLVIRFEVDPSLPGGIALYGEHFGRYPVDPSIVFHLRQ